MINNIVNNLSLFIFLLLFIGFGIGWLSLWIITKIIEHRQLKHKPVEIRSLDAMIKMVERDICSLKVGEIPYIQNKIKNDSVALDKINNVTLPELGNVLQVLKMLKKGKINNGQ